MPERFTTEEFIEKARLLHGDKYDYSKTEYVNSNTKVQITCPIHGDFEQIPYSHLSGSGCNKCGYERIRLALSSNTKEFIEKARLVHKDNYGYSKTEYVNLNTKVQITCPIHGDFEQIPDKHLSGKGCRRCGNERIRLALSSNIEEFIKKARLFHGDKYDYSKTEYVNSNTKVQITCPIHGEFEQKPHDHLSGSGCNKCGYEKIGFKLSSNTEEFIEKAILVHGDRYDYSKVVYVKNRLNVTITCPTHGDFEQTPNSHLSGKGCQVCGGSMLSSTEEFIKKVRLVRGDKYDYSKTEYVNSKTNVTITCPIHGDFEQTPQGHLSGKGCPRCINKTEGLLFSVLNELFPQYTILDQVVVCDDGKLRIDFHIVELNLYIELDGDQHFRQVSSWEAPELTQAHDLTKTMRVLKKGQSLVRIYQPWVASDTNNWLEKLKANIREYEKPTLVFIGPEGIYDKHKEDLRYSSLSNNLYETSTFS